MGLASQGWMLVDADGLTWAGVVFLWLVFFFFGSIVLICDSRMSPPW